MAELAMLAAVRDKLVAVGLTPSPATVGFIEPAVAADLPALVLSIESSDPLDAGLGDAAVAMIGALSAVSTIDLAQPFLPDDPSVSLLSSDRSTLALLHGGLVRRDGTTGALSAADISVSVAGNPRVLTPGAPSPTQFSVDPSFGRVRFGAALAPAGQVQASYFVGQWTRAVERIRGVLRVDACAAAADAVLQLAQGIAQALTPPAQRPAIGGMASLSLRSISSVGPREAENGNLRRRTLRFQFEYEHNVDVPDSSGGIIQSIPITATLVVSDAEMRA
jgi:hypothetical protein